MNISPLSSAQRLSFALILLVSAPALSLETLPLGASSSEALSVKVKGEWRQGQLLIGQVAPGSKVEFLERPLRVDTDGTFVIGLGRDAPEQVQLLVNRDGQQKRHEFQVEQRQYNIQRIEGVPPRTVTPPPEELERIQRDNAATRQARRQDLSRRDFLQEFQWPITGRITGVYGSQRFYNGEGRQPHFGVDVAAPVGAPVRAPVDGVVTLVHEDMFFSGGTMIVDHGHGVSSTFLHLSKILVEEGVVVSQGDVIAEVGATGRATGPHLDWRINWFNERLDPQLLVGPMPTPDS